MKVSDRLTAYEAPPDNAIDKDTPRLWREHYIYHAAEADAYTTLLHLFDNNMDAELKSWLREVIKIRREDAAKADEKSSELTMTLWKRERETQPI